MTSALIQVVASVYALENYIQPKHGMLFKTLGRIESFDGMAAEYMYKENDNSVIDGIDVVGHASNNGRFIVFKEKNATLTEEQRLELEGLVSQAEAARDDAFLNAGMYATTGAGLAATTSGKTFLVTTATANQFDLYTNTAGVAVFVNTLKVASQTDIDTLYLTADDAGVQARAAALSILLGGTDPEIINAIQTTGGYFNFLSTDNLLSGVVKANFQAFANVTFSRGSSALALNSAGVYESFATNVIRKTSKGVLLETAATNLVALPTSLSGTGWSGSNQTLTTGISSPNAANNATSVTQNNSTDSGRNLAFTPPSAGNYQLSFILKKGEIPYTLITYSGGGYVAVQGLYVDWDAFGGPSLGTSGIGSPSAYSIEPLSNGWYRVKLLIAPTSTAPMTITIRSTSDGTYTNRGSGASAGQIIWYFWHAQIESGTVCSSPILTASTRLADLASITWAGSGQTTDSASVNYTTSQTTTLTRASFADSTKLNLITDNGAWIGKYITSIVLTPSQPAAFRTMNQRDSDIKATTQSGVLDPAVTALRYAMAKLGQGHLPVNVGDYNRFMHTDSGAALYLASDGSNVYFNGSIYGTEADMLAACNGTRSGQTVVIGGYVDTDNELASIDLSASNGGFTQLNGNGSFSYSGGKLTHTATANPSGFSKKYEGLSGQAVAFVSNCKFNGAGSIQLAFSRVDAAISSGQLTSISSTLSDTTVYGSPNSGYQWWVGSRQVGGTPTVAEFYNARLYKAYPAKGFPNGNFCAYFEGVAPATLPSTTEVIFQGDINKNDDRFRVELRAAGAVWLIQSGAVGTIIEQNQEVQIGTMTANTAYKLAFGKTNNRIFGATNGVGAYLNSPLAVGFSHIRIGRSLSGEVFSGTITKYNFFAKCENLLWFKKVTTISTAPKIKRYAQNKIVVVGDSYAEFSSTGIGAALIDAGFDVINLGAGGTTFAQQYAAIIARTDLYDLTFLWWDGSPNDRLANGNYDDEKTKLEAVIAAMGHNRWLYIRNGQIPTGAPGQTSIDMTNFYNYLKAKYGAIHVFDAQPIAATFAATDTAAALFAQDQTDLSYGQYPHSAMFLDATGGVDYIHLGVDVRIAVVNALHSQLLTVCSLI